MPETYSDIWLIAGGAGLTILLGLFVWLLIEIQRAVAGWLAERAAARADADLAVASGARPPAPRSVARAGRILLFGGGFIVAAMGIELAQGMLSVSGAVIDQVLDHSRKFTEGAWKVCLALAFVNYIVDHQTYRRFSLLELFTNRPAEWRTAEEPFEPFASTHAQAAAILGYFYFISTIVDVLGGVA